MFLKYYTLQIYFIFILLPLLFTCNESAFAPGKIEKTNIIYETSFESENDFAGWKSIDTSCWRIDVHPLCGTKSIIISGGCLMPTASYILYSPGYTCSVTVSCYGKEISGGGTLNLDIGQNIFYGLQLHIQDTVWKKYETADTLIWPADTSLWLTLNAGGIAGAQMLIDSIKVLKVK